MFMASHELFGGRFQGRTMLSLDAAGSGPRVPFGPPNSVDYTIDVPATVVVKAQSASGQIDIDGVSGDVQADASSGRLSL